MAENAQQISIVKKDEYLLVTFPPYESVHIAESHISAMYDVVDEHGYRRLLIDLTATRKQIPIVQIFNLGIYLVSKFGLAHCKMAVLASPEAVYPDRFGETVVRNRGLDLIRFLDNEQEALDWLLAPNPA